MAKSIKFNDNIYLDSSGVMHKKGTTRTPLNTYLNNIIESGNNDNGAWVKYADGTMIQYGETDADIVPAGNGITKDIILPQQFINYYYIPLIQHKNNVNAWSYVMFLANQRTKSKYTINLCNNGTFETGVIGLYWFAIGRWK